MNNKITELNETSHERRMRKIIEYEKEGRKQCKNLSFKLVGILNMFDLIPGFVDPIFMCMQKKEAMYVQVGEEERDIITFFEKLDNYGEVKQKIVKLNNDRKYMNKKFTIHSKPLYAFQMSKEIYIGNYCEMESFLKNYQTDDENLLEEIKDFLNLESSNI